MPRSSAARALREDRTPRRRDLTIVSATTRTREAKVKPANDEAAHRYAPCRAMGHTWQHLGRANPEEAHAGSNPYNVVAIVSVCSTCGTRRTRWMSRWGNRGSLTYDHPEGYERRGDDRMSLQAWRVRFLVDAGLVPE